MTSSFSSFSRRLRMIKKIAIPIRAIATGRPTPRPAPSAAALFLLCPCPLPPPLQFPWPLPLLQFPVDDDFEAGPVDPCCPLLPPPCPWPVLPPEDCPVPPAVEPPSTQTQTHHIESRIAANKDSVLMVTGIAATTTPLYATSAEAAGAKTIVPPPPCVC